MVDIIGIGYRAEERALRTFAATGGGALADPRDAANARLLANTTDRR